MQNKGIGCYQRDGRPQFIDFLSMHEKEAGSIRSILKLASVWHDRWFMRRAMVREMQAFNDAMYEDFGMTREEAQKEAEKPFWRA
jgi:uncharacterized protein YjiS (DUF1127 family)